MPTIDWSTSSLEPHHDGDGGQLVVDVRGGDAGFARRFNEQTYFHFERGEVRGGRWGEVVYDEVEGHIRVEDLYGDEHGPIRDYLEEEVARASR